MNHERFETLSHQPAGDLDDTTAEWLDTLKAHWQTSAIGATGGLVIVMITLLTGNAWFVAALAIGIAVAAAVIHLLLSKRNAALLNQIELFEERLANEASASRILGGIRVLNSVDGMSKDARLATASRMATDYPAAVVFNLRDAHGIFAPSNWSYEGQLSHIRDEFEAIDSNAPGAAAARQGSAIVMSATDDVYQQLPSWAEQAGFTQGIVAPITRGLDTIGVVYVLKKSDELPTLSEMEQLELIVSFGSIESTLNRVNSSSSVKQPFRIIEKASTSDSQSGSTNPIRMAGFALNPDSERLEMDGMMISLSPTEYLLMHALASSPSKPVSPVDLAERCWTKDARPADNAVDVAIFRLRKKLSKTSSGKGLIKTVRGNGYMFVPPTVSESAAVVAD